MIDKVADFSLIPCRYLAGGKDIDFAEVITYDAVSQKDSIQYEKYEKPSFVARNLSFCLLSGLIVIPATLIGLVLKVITLAFNQGFRKTQFESAKQIQVDQRKVSKVIVMFAYQQTASILPKIIERIRSRYPNDTSIEDFSLKRDEVHSAAQDADVIMARIEDKGGNHFFGGDGAFNTAFQDLYLAKHKESRGRLMMMVKPDGSTLEIQQMKNKGRYPEVEYIVTS